MSIENVKQSLLQEAGSEAKKIISASQAQAGEIISAAQHRAREIEQDAKKSTEGIIFGMKNEKISSAKLKAKKIVSQARDETVEKALESVWKELKALPKSGSYEKIMKDLITSGINELGKDAIVQTNSADGKIAKKYHGNIHPQAANISGGAIIMNKDKNIFVDNSLESLYNSKKEQLEMIIYSELFERKI